MASEDFLTIREVYTGVRPPSPPPEGPPLTTEAFSGAETMNFTRVHYEENHGYLTTAVYCTSLLLSCVSVGISYSPLPLAQRRIACGALTIGWVFPTALKSLWDLNEAMISENELKRRKISMIFNWIVGGVAATVTISNLI